MHDIGPNAGKQTFRTADMEIGGGDGPPWFDVTAENFPTVYKCLNDISHDAGYGAGHDTYSVSPRWEAELPGIEAALVMLNDDARNEFSIGDQAEADRMIERRPELARASALFNDFFEE